MQYTVVFFIRLNITRVEFEKACKISINYNVNNLCQMTVPGKLLGFLKI